MALPSVHRCLQLSDENEQLLKKLKKLHIKNKELEKNLAQFQEKLHLQQLMHDYVTSRDVQVQTESQLWHKGGHNKDLNLESESVRLLQMYNNLQKRYMKEIKTNQEQSETIKNLTKSSSKLTEKEKANVFSVRKRDLLTCCAMRLASELEQRLFCINLVVSQLFKVLDLHSGYVSSHTQLSYVCSVHFKHFPVSRQIKIHELEHNLREQRQRIEQLECKKVSKKARAVSEKRSQTPEGEVTSCRHIYKKKESCCSKYLELLLKEIKKLKKENEKLSTERRALRNELAGLDKDFFEEIEDLKHAVQESVKLNNQYEKCLKQISAIYGLPLTTPL